MNKEMDNFRFIRKTKYFMLPYGNWRYHIGVFGVTGMGKSVSVEALATRLYEMGWKIFDLYGGGRMEGAFYSLPSEYDFWKTPKRTRKGEILEATSYPTRLLFPMIKSRLPREIPNIGNVFTIPINSLDEGDLYALIGNELSKSEKSVWNRLIEDKIIGKKSSGWDLLNSIRLSNKVISKSRGMVSTKVKAYGQDTLYYSFKPLVNEMLLSSAKNPLALDLASEIKDRKTITTLITRYVPDRFVHFIINYFIRKIYELNDKLKKKIFFVIREIQDILPREAVTPQGLMVKRQIERVLRQGRGRRVFFLVDGQEPSQITLLKGQFQMIITHQIRSPEDLMELLPKSIKSQVPKEDYYKISFLDVGEAMYITPFGYGFGRIIPARSKHREPNEDFMELWRKRGFGFKDTREDINKVESEYEESINRWDTKIKIMKDREAKKKVDVVVKKVEKPKKQENKEVEEVDDFTPF